MQSSLARPFSGSPSASPLSTVEYCRFVTSASESARQRFAQVESHVVHGETPAAGFSITVALPLSYGKRRRRRYPLLVLADGEDIVGSAIEMQRVLASTREAREGILVCHDDPWLSPADAAAQAARIVQIVAWCRERFRVQQREVTFFDQGRARACAQALRGHAPAVIDHWITAAQRLPEATPQGSTIPSLNHGILSLWGTGRDYGSEAAPLCHPLVSGALQKCRPLLKRLRREALPGGSAEGRNILHSSIMDRDFEIFVSLPRQLRPGSNCAAVIALDANSTWSCVSEIATRMARAGEIDDVITVGIGTPRTEGDVAFGLRRFEELSPPAGEVAFQGDLGRFFLSIFATFGLDARKHFGLAPLFHRFLSEELLPMLLRTLPIDPARLCLVGHSAAGTYAAYEIAQPDSLFAGVAVLSPGVRISDDWMLKADGGLGGIAHRKQVFVAIGGAERDNAFNKLAGIPLSERYADALRQQGAGDNIDYACLDGETHTTAFARAYALFLARRFARTEEETI